MIKKLLKLFTKKIAKSKSKDFRVEKVIKENSDKLYFKWEGCDNSFTSWIDKKDIDLFSRTIHS